MGNLKGCLSHSHFLTHTHILTDTSEMKKSAANSLVDTCLKCSPVGDRKKFFILLDTISLPGWVGVLMYSMDTFFFQRCLVLSC